VFVQKIFRQCSKVGRNHHKRFVKHKIIMFGVMALFLTSLELYLYMHATYRRPLKQQLYGKTYFSLAGAAWQSYFLWQTIRRPCTLLFIFKKYLPQNSKFVCSIY
jgi:hypothetical protein